MATAIRAAATTRRAGVSVVRPASRGRGRTGTSQTERPWRCSSSRISTSGYPPGWCAVSRRSARGPNAQNPLVASVTVRPVMAERTADSPRCVSKGEYRQVHRGMSRGQVHRVFDTRGHRRAFARVGRFRSEVRVYRGCGRRSAVSVAYSRGRVRAKSAIFR